MKTNKHSLVHIVYKDHVLFRNSDPSLYKPVLRECVGWLIKDSSEAVWILWDRALEKVPHERVCIEQSGLVLLKSEILEMKKF